MKLSFHRMVQQEAKQAVLWYNEQKKGWEMTSS
jgi:hypothetical protein